MLFSIQSLFLIADEGYYDGPECWIQNFPVPAIHVDLRVITEAVIYGGYAFSAVAANLLVIIPAKMMTFKILTAPKPVFPVQLLEKYRRND